MTAKKTPAAPNPALPRAKTNKIRQNYKLDPVLVERLRDSAQQRGMTVTAVIEEAARHYLDGQEVLTEIAGTEARLAATMTALDREVGQVYSAVQINMAMLDQMAQFLFFNTEDLPDSEVAGARMRMNRRREAFIRELPNSYNKRRRRAAIVAAVEDQESQHGEAATD